MFKKLRSTSEQMGVVMRRLPIADWGMKADIVEPLSIPIGCADEINRLSVRF